MLLNSNYYTAEKCSCYKSRSNTLQVLKTRQFVKIRNVLLAKHEGQACRAEGVAKRSVSVLLLKTFQINFHSTTEAFLKGWSSLSGS